jgi:hypothetical protein
MSVAHAQNITQPSRFLFGYGGFFQHHYLRLCGETRRRERLLVLGEIVFDRIRCASDTDFSAESVHEDRWIPGKNFPGRTAFEVRRRLVKEDPTVGPCERGGVNERCRASRHHGHPTFGERSCFCKREHLLKVYSHQ